MGTPPARQIDLVVEELTSEDEFMATLRRVIQFLRAGVQRVWLLDPRERSLIFYRFDGSVGVVDEVDEQLGKEDTEQIRCTLAELFGPKGPGDCTKQ